MGTGSTSTDLADLRATLEEMRRRGFALPESFGDFVARENASLLKFEHVPRMIEVADRVARGETTRLLVMMPPRYFKSTIFSRMLPAFFLRQNPHLHCGLASYGAELAWSLSEEARNHYESDGGRLSDVTGAKKRWKTNRGGEMWAAGVGGPLLGFGYHLGVVDDPTDPVKAHSPTYQKSFREWWPSKFLSRQEAAARIVFVMQRLGNGDPVDFLLRREVGEDTEAAPMHWHVVCLQEIYDDRPLGRWKGPRGLPETCTLEPDWRKPGEVLAPSYFDERAVLMMQRDAGTHTTAAQRQQSPAQAVGDFWTESWFKVHDTLPGTAYNLGWDWDLAYTDDEKNSASAGVQSARGPGRNGVFTIYIEDADWDWMEFPEATAFIRERSAPHYVEAKASGKSAAQVLRRLGIPVHEVPVKGSKFTRSTLVQPIVSAGRVSVRRSLLRKLLKGDRQGLLSVTAQALVEESRDLDLNDAFVQALRRHIRKMEHEDQADEFPSGTISSMR